MFHTDNYPSDEIKQKQTVPEYQMLCSRENVNFPNQAQDSSLAAKLRSLLFAERVNQVNLVICASGFDRIFSRRCADTLHRVLVLLCCTLMLLGVPFKSIIKARKSVCGCGMSGCVILALIQRVYVQFTACFHWWSS